MFFFWKRGFFFIHGSGMVESLRNVGLGERGSRKPVISQVSHKKRDPNNTFLIKLFPLQSLWKNPSLFYK